MLHAPRDQHTSYPRQANREMQRDLQRWNLELVWKTNHICCFGASSRVKPLAVPRVVPNWDIWLIEIKCPCFNLNAAGALLSNFNHKSPRDWRYFCLKLSVKHQVIRGHDELRGRMQYSYSLRYQSFVNLGVTPAILSELAPRQTLLKLAGCPNLEPKLSKTVEGFGCYAKTEIGRKRERQMVYNKSGNC